MQPEPSDNPAPEKVEGAPAASSADQSTGDKPKPSEQGPPKQTIAYRIEPSRSFEINKQHSEREARARTLAILRSSLFGRKRYQEIYLNCSLNNLFNALRIARFLHLRVANLSLTIKFIPIKIVEVFSDGKEAESHQITDRKRVEIKLTTSPTEQDMLEPGFNPGFPKEKLPETPIEGLNLRGPGDRQERKRRDYKEGNEGKKRERNDDDRKKRRKGEGRGEGQGEGRGQRRNEGNRPNNKEYNQNRDKRDQEAQKRRNDDQRDYRRAQHEEPEDDEDFKRDNRKDDRRDNRRDEKRDDYRNKGREDRRDDRRDERRDDRGNDRREEKKTRGGPFNKSGGGRGKEQPVQRDHHYNPSHLTRDERD